MNIEKYQSLIQEKIEKIDFPKNPIELYDPIRYFLKLPAKRIRPVLLLMACNLFNGNLNKAINPALGIELFHNFTLLHDDIMDNAPLRRGHQTVHEKWNQEIAILAGDALFIKAQEMLLQVENNLVHQVLEITTKFSLGVCEGQQFDMNFETQTEVSIKDYLKMIELKTSVLVAGAMQIGALIAGTNFEVSKKIYEFGKNIGIAFQLQDDILDVFGDKTKFGKQVGGDIIANKKTYLMLKAFELADKKTKQNLKEYFYQSNFSSTEKVEKVKSIYKDLKVKSFAENKMQELINLAFLKLDKIKVDSTKKEALKKFTMSLIHREN